MAGTKFGKLYKKNKIRMRDQVITIIRNAEMADLADPGLGLIKRQILAKTNALLGEPLLKGVIFSDFAVVEQ
jgi:flagellar FliL protein